MLGILLLFLAPSLSYNYHFLFPCSLALELQEKCRSSREKSASFFLLELASKLQLLHLRDHKFHMFNFKRTKSKWLMEKRRLIARERLKDQDEWFDKTSKQIRQTSNADPISS